MAFRIIAILAVLLSAAVAAHAAGLQSTVETARQSAGGFLPLALAISYWISRRSG